MAKVSDLQVGDYVRYRGRQHIWKVIQKIDNGVQIQRWKVEEGLIGNDTRWLFNLGQDIETVSV
jgi:hypothetical protein